MNVIRSLAFNYEFLFAAHWLYTVSIYLALVATGHKIFGDRSNSVGFVLGLNVVGLAGALLCEALLALSMLTRILGFGGMNVGGYLLTAGSLAAADLYRATCRRRVHSFSKRSLIAWFGTASLIAFGAARLVAPSEMRNELHKFEAGLSLNYRLFHDPIIGRVAQEIYKTSPSEYLAISEKLYTDSTRDNRYNPGYFVKLANEYLLVHRKDLARAPDETLKDVAREKASFLKDLLQNPKNCELTITGVGSKDPYWSQEVGEGALIPWSKLATSIVIAARAGMKNPVPRDLDPPSAEYFAAVHKAMKKLDRESQAVLMPRSKADAPSPLSQCRASVRFWTAVAALPDAEAAQIVATEAATTALVADKFVA